MDEEKKRQSIIYELPQTMDMSSVNELKLKFNELVDSESDVLIDGSKVDKAHSAAAQLLVSLIKALNTNEKNVQFTNLSTTLDNLIQGIGLKKYFEIKE